MEPDAVPTEVRDWLALTFTRSMSNIKRRGEEKPKFRSVANAIRAGIMVDRYETTISYLLWSTRNCDADIAFHFSEISAMEDLRDATSRLTGGAKSFSKTVFPLLSTGLTQEDRKTS